MTWTYETLAEADKATLEKVLLTSPAPDPAKLDGWRYCGWNHEWIASHISGEKFVKAFWKKGDRWLGFNEVVLQDNKGYRGEWKRQMLNHRPVQLAHFKVGQVKSEPKEPLYAPYQHCGTFNYGLPKLNSGVNFIFRCIRDMVVTPNPGDHELLLCKAYFRRTPKHADFYCYFLLGHRTPVDFPPW